MIDTKRPPCETDPTVNPFEGFLNIELDALYEALDLYRQSTREDLTVQRLRRWCAEERFARIIPPEGAA